MSMIEINSNKLHLFHQNQETLGKQEALTERKKLCLGHELEEKSCIDSMKDVFSPLPMIAQLASVSQQRATVPVSVLFTPPESKKGTDDKDREEDVDKTCIPQKQKCCPVILCLTFHVHCYPSHWLEPQEEDCV